MNVKRMAGAVAASVACALVLVAATAATATAADRSLAAGTRFYVPPPSDGATRQVVDLAVHGRIQDALRIVAMESVSRGVWITQGTPAEARLQVERTMLRATLLRTVPVIVLYNIPGRDCGGFSAGGAQTTAAYASW